jgi:phage N-6-adenine-methyltransferase
MTALVLAPTQTLLTVERARDLLEQARTLDEVKHIADQAAALRAYLRSKTAGIEAQNVAAEIVLLAQRKLGAAFASIDKAKPAGGRGRVVLPKSGATKADALAELGVRHQDASRWEALAAVPEEEFTRHVEAVKARGSRLTTTGTISAVSHADDYDSDEWYTPPDDIELVRQVLGGIDLDVATCEHAQKVVQAKRFFTKAENGQAKRWHGRVFCNPPYSQPLCAEFVARFIAEYVAKRMKAGIILLNASTDTAWAHSLMQRFPVCFTRGRTAFLRRNGEAAEGNRVGQMFAYAGEDRPLFRRVFHGRGTVMGKD